MAITDILKNAALGGIKNTLTAYNPAASTALGAISTVKNTLYNNSTNSAKSQLSALGSSGTQQGLSSSQNAAALSKPTTPTTPTSNYNYNNGYSYSAPTPTPDYEAGNYGTTSNFTSNNTSGQTTPSNTSYFNPYNDQLKALQDKINSLNDSFGNYLKPGQDETDTLSQLDALTGQQKNLSASEALGLSNIQAKPIALEFQQGQGAALQRQAAAQMAALGAEAEPLTTKLARLQSSRQSAADLAKYQLENIKGEYSDLQGESKPIEVGGNLVRLNPSTGQYETLFSPAGKNAEGFTLNEGEQRYDANGNLIASGAPKTAEQQTNDIKEYNFAKSQGYGGTFTDYQSSKGGGGSNNLNELLSPNDAQTLGVPYGTTRGQAASMGINISNTKPQSADQLKAADFATRMQSADQIINQLQNVGASTNWGGLGQYAPNVLKSSDRQQLEQAQRTFLNAVLRRESGAAISPAEFDSGSKQYFPQPGDSPQVLQNKAALRTQVTQNMQRQAGGGGQSGGGGDSLDQALNAAGFKSPLNTGLKGSTAMNIEQKFPNGTTGGQCAHFARQLVDIPPLGDGLNDKKTHVDQMGMPAAVWKNNPQVGDVIISNDNPNYGHVCVVNAVLPNGQVRVTESNYHGDQKVNNTRVVSVNSPRIYGAIRAPLKV